MAGVITQAQTTKQFPILGKYENYWPVRDMLKLYLKYTAESYRKQGNTFRQKTKARKGRIVGEVDQIRYLETRLLVGEPLGRVDLQITHREDQRFWNPDSLSLSNMLNTTSRDWNSV